MLGQVIEGYAEWEFCQAPLHPQAFFITICDTDVATQIGAQAVDRVKRFRDRTARTMGGPLATTVGENGLLDFAFSV